MFVPFLFACVLQAPVEAPSAPAQVAIEDIAHAATVIGLEFTPEELEQMRAAVIDDRAGYERLQQLSLSNAVPPAFVFSPLLPGFELHAQHFAPQPIVLPSVERPAQLEELAFADIATLASLIRARKVSAVELTRMYLARLERLDPLLHCVVHRTDARALAQAERLDRELADGHWRGLLHGIPWGAKDLLAVAGTPTTWGSQIYAEQRFARDATVVERLDQAGAVLIAKLSLGELAYGDVWFGGQTRNPWKPEKGSSGSSAGSASATVAGCVAFAIGSETLGSIVSPSSVCGATGLRPTFGRVSRTGAMALSWTMDKLGPICRSVADASIVLAAIQGPDGVDATVVDRPFVASAPVAVAKWRVGYVSADFPEKSELAAVLEELRALDVELVPVTLPSRIPVGDLLTILSCEAATAFDELTRTNEDEGMVKQDAEAWPTIFRAARLVPAVEYLRACRLRTQLMTEFDATMKPIDVLVHASSGPTLLITNLTGHPTVVVPCGFRDDGTPRSVSFTGSLFGEATMCALAQAWQDKTAYHRRHPKL